MNGYLTTLSLALALAASAAAERGEERVKVENWNSMTMEGTALMGEMMYQRRDFSGAKDKFRDSLGASLKVGDPQRQWMALDLYRSAEIEMREGGFATARQHLEILINRYPDSEWTRKGRRLLALIPEAGAEEEQEEDFAAPAPSLTTPEHALRRLQAAFREERVADALRECRLFRERYDRHPYAAEVRLLEGLLDLRQQDPAQAVRALDPLQHLGDEALAAKARYLLGAAYLALGDLPALEDAVPALEPSKAKEKWTALAQVWRAAADARLGRSAQAARRYEAVLRTRWKSPLLAYAHAALGVELERLGKTGPAAEALLQARALAEQAGLDGLASAVELDLAHLQYKQRRYDRAAAAYAEFSRRYSQDPARPLALYQRGMALRRAGKPANAVPAFEQLAAEHADSEYAPKAHLQLGQLYSELGSTRKAIAHYEDMAKLPAAAAGSDTESLLLVAQVHYNKRRYQDAIPLYWRFLESAPRDARAHQVEDLLLTSYWMGEREDPGLQRAVTLYPDHPIVARVRWSLAGKAYKAGDCDAAEENFQRILEDFPKAPFAADSLFYQAECRMRRGDSRTAADAYRRVAERFPKSRFAKESRFKLAGVLYEAGDYQGSAEAYRRMSLEKGAGSLASDAALNRALALVKAERKPAALAAYEDLLTRFPRHPKASWAWLQTGLLRQELGRLAPAALAYAKVRGEDRPQALLQEGRCREKLKQRGLALKAYEELRRARPADDAFRLSGLLRLGLLYELQSQAVRARPLYREILRLSRNESLTAVARKRLEAESPELSRGDSAAPYVTSAASSEDDD